MRRRIAVVTTSRADYSHLFWVLKELQAREDLDTQLIALGAHFSREFGHTVEEIEKDGIRIDEKIECLLDSDTDIGMAKTIGVATLGLSDILGRLRPELLLLVADRYEMLAPACAALALRIPVAHIEGGEVSEGAIDDAVRNALTKLSHLHFTPTETARRRVLALGEEAWRVHRVGAPSLDHLRRSALLPPSALETELGVALEPGAVVVAYHPVTLVRDTLQEADEVFRALKEIPRLILFCFPNTDAGSRDLIRRARRFCEHRTNARLFVNLNPVKYWSLLSCTSLLLGNSSSGIMESASLRLPCVNVGIRQQGRERARNMLDAPAECGAILRAVEKALDPAFRESLRDLVNPYGDGQASERIVRILAEVELGERLLQKKALPVSDAWRRDET